MRGYGDLRVLLLSTDDPALADRIERIARETFHVVFAGRYPRTATFPAHGWASLVTHHPADLLLNVLAPMVVPANVLAACPKGAINFHPSTPSYPGVGGASYALYHRDTVYGATAHLMTPAVDQGPIIRVKYFPIAPEDTCDSLYARACATAVDLFAELAQEIQQWASFLSGETWRRKPITRAEFDRWMEIPVEAPVEDRERKIRACRHPAKPGPYLVTKVPVTG